LQNKIKSLKWVELSSLSKDCYAKTSFGDYRITNEKDWNWQWKFYPENIFSAWMFNFKSIEECKENAEKHWQEKMQAALEIN